MPMRLRSSKSSLVLRSGTNWPSTVRVPRPGLMRPPMRFISVVLPQPLPPMMAVTLPRRMGSVMPFRIGRSPYIKWISRISTRTSLSGAVLDEALHHRWIGECGGIAEIGKIVRGNLAQDAAHDLAGARLGQTRRPLNHAGRGDRADLLAHLLHQLLAQAVRGWHADLERDVTV